MDRFGNINTSYISDMDHAKVKLPGLGGAPDIAAMAGHLVIIINYQKYRLIEKVDFITSPNILDCGDARKKAGLPGGGPAVIITDGGILQPYSPTNEFHPASTHPGHSLGKIQRNTSRTPQCIPDVPETPPLTNDKMAALHHIDKEGFRSS